MPKRFTEEQIEWMRNERRKGRAYSQIADNFPTEYPGEKRPSDSAVFNQASSVQVQVEETMEEDESLEDTGEQPTRPISEERKKQEIEILNLFIHIFWGSLGLFAIFRLGASFWDSQTLNSL